MRADYFNNQHPSYQKIPDSIIINDVRFDTPVISFRPSRCSRLLGMKFVMHWSSFSIDPIEKKIEFYL
jgi:hypothetical protein